MSRLLARWAESLFWLARYMERAENLARLLEVQQTFARDSRGTQDWGVMLAINGDRARFHADHADASPSTVLRFYTIDRSNPTSILFNLFAARENARALRPMIPTELWMQLNTFYNRVAALSPAGISEDRLARLCAMIKEGCETHTGIAAGTFYRDEAWCFYQLGAAIETADQTTRLLDAKLMSLEARGDADAGSAVDVGYWMALLRGVAGYQAFRRRHPRSMTPAQVTAFLLCEPCLPRSVAQCIGSMEDQLTILRRHYHLGRTGRLLEQLDALRDLLDVRKVGQVIQRGDIHIFNDHLQRELIDLTDRIATAFFGGVAITSEAAEPEPAGAAPPAAGGAAQTQSQSQSASSP